MQTFNNNQQRYYFSVIFNQTYIWMWNFVQFLFSQVCRKLFSVLLIHRNQIFYWKNLLIYK